MTAVFNPLRCCPFCKPKVEVNLNGQDVKDLPLIELLPEGYEYALCSYSFIEESGFEATISLPLYTPDRLKKWKDDFEQSSMSTYRVEQTFPNVQQKVLFKGRYYCHHKGSGKKSAGKLTTKATNCLSKMTMTLLNVPDNYRGKNPHIPEYPASVYLRWTHNHAICAASALRYRDVGQAAQDKLIAFFDDGLSPSCALDALHKSLEDEPNDVSIRGDRQIVPDFFFVNRLFIKHFEGLYGRFKGKVEFDEILEHIKTLDVKYASHIDGNDLIIAIVTPLMERVHKLEPHSGEIAFMDASHGMDRYGAQVLMLMTHTRLCGLPLGSIVSTSLKAEHIQKGLSMLSDLLGDIAFYGRGKNGPAVFMTDHCEAEKRAIQAVFPGAVLLISAFHILQAFWRYLSDRKFGVEKNNRSHILNLMKGLLYAADCVELEEKYNHICGSGVLAMYPAVVEQVKKYWAMKEDWALALRRDVLVIGSSTNNVVESCFRTLNDRILNRQKCCNVVQLLNYTAIFVSKFYSRKLVQLISIPEAASASSPSKKAQAKEAEIAQEEVIHVEGTTYKVLKHYVDIAIGTCTCYFGSYGTACKHQFAVKHRFGEYYAAAMPVSDEAEKLRYLEIATGKTQVPSNWSDPVADSDTQDVKREITNISDTEEVEIGHFRESFRDVCTQIEQRVTSDPDTLLEPANKFICRIKERLSKKSSLASAFVTFGSSLPKRSQKNLLKVRLPTVARRKYSSGGSRHQKAGPQPPGSCRKRRVAFPGEPSMLPVRKSKRTKQPHSFGN